MSTKVSVIKESLTNYLAEALFENESEDETLNEGLDEADILSSTDSGFLFEEYSKTLESVREIAGTWLTHRFDDDPWIDDYRPYIQLEVQQECLEEETESIGVLTDAIIGSCLSYLERSPEDPRHVLCKCVLSSKLLTDISEIRYYHYIQYLDLSWNELTTLSALGQLPFLQYLDVSHNNLDVLLDFKAPFYLTFINFSYNLVSIIPDLTLFWSITHLNLSHNKIVRITGLKKLRFLSYLDLSYNEIEKLENLNNLRLQFLILHHNDIENSQEDCSVEFKTCPCIRSIDVSNNHLTSLKLFKNTGNLESIDISKNGISSLLEIYYLQNLRYLSRVNFSGNPICEEKFYVKICLSIIKNLMVLDKKEITAEQRIDAKKSYEVNPSFPARESRIDLILLQQINQPYIGPYIVPFDQPPPIVVMLVGPPGSMKKDIIRLFIQTNTNLEYGVSHTTRPKLIDEVHGKDYYFVSTEEFKNLTRRGRFIAVSEFNGHSYGIVHEELRKCMDKILLFHSDVNSALSLRIMGIHPKLVLALPRDEITHLKWLKMKYYYDFIEQGIIRIKNCPECVKEAASLEQNEDTAMNIINVQDILEHIIQKVVESDTNYWSTSEESSFQDMGNTVHFNIPEKDINDHDMSDAKNNAAGILKRRVSDSIDDFTQTNNELLNPSLTECPALKEHQKRVSFTDLPDISHINNENDHYKYKSISEAMVGRIQSFSRPLLSILSTPAIKGETISTEISEESSESYNIEDEKVNEFTKKILESRNELLELHWSNPGLFREATMELLKSLIIVSEKAANIARTCRQHEHLFELLVQKKTSEEANPRFIEDFKTLADVLIQEMVKHDIKGQVLSNNIVGEENNILENKLGVKIRVEIKDTEKETADLLETILNGDQIAATLLAAEVHREIKVEDVKTKIPTEEFDVNLEELGVWIDPIDCTTEYINGSKGVRERNIYLKGLKCVTVLIGVYNSISGLPVMGVVNRPFVDDEDFMVPLKCIWGVSFDNISLNSGIACIGRKGVICISSSEKVEVKQILQDKGFHLVEASGAGYKILTVILGLADAYLLTKETTFKWDTCAPHSILKALGGDIIDFEGALQNNRSSITYFIDKNNCNVHGIIAYREMDVLLDIINALNN